MPKTTPTSYRLSAQARRLISRVAKRLGISQTSVIEVAVRRLERDTKQG